MSTKSKWNHAHAIRNGINAPPISSDTSKLGRAYGMRWNRRIASAGETSPPYGVKKNNGISKQPEKTARCRRVISSPNS